MTIADIAVAGTRASGDGSLSYAVPAHVRDSVEIGQVVWVPLRGKPALGVIVRLHTDAPAFAVKPLLAIVDPPMRVSVGQLDTARWLARQSASSLYDSLALFLPPGASHHAQPYLRLTDPDFDLRQFTPAQGRLLKLLAERGEMSLEMARSALGTSLTSVVPALEEAGFHLDIEDTPEVYADAAVMSRYNLVVQCMTLGSAAGRALRCWLGRRWFHSRGGYSGSIWIEPRLADRAHPQRHGRGSRAYPGSASARDEWEPRQSSGADPGAVRRLV